MSEGGSMPAAVMLHSLERAPIGYAAVRGREHTLFFANAEFRRMSGLNDGATIDRPFAELFAPAQREAWVHLLDQATEHAIVTANAEVPVLAPTQDGATWSCSIWPVDSDNHHAEYCVIEVHENALPDHTLLNVAEQLLLSSLREAEVARQAETARTQAVFLSEATRKLTESLDVEMTLATIAVLALPSESSWCIVDVMTKGGSMRRIAIVHPDPERQTVAAELSASWQPSVDDFFGLPLALRIRRSRVFPQVTDEMLASAAHAPENIARLRELEFSSLLVVPLLAHDVVIGAVTFVKGSDQPAFTVSDIELAETVSARSALALDNARLYHQAEWLRREAEKSNIAKAEFLRRMSHEFRTPLNAVLGYVELIDMGLHGAVTDLQRADLDRIRQSNRHLITLINEILDYARISSGAARYRSIPVHVGGVIDTVVGMLTSLADQKQIVCEKNLCGEFAIAHADPDRVEQIVVNLFSNAIKYSQPGAHIRIECSVSPETVQVSVIDSGPGIPSDNLESIFEPFMQASLANTRVEGGVGLGLAISRDLAVAMHGTLTVRSELGEGSCFTLTLPRGADSAGVGT